MVEDQDVDTQRQEKETIVCIKTEACRSQLNGLTLSAKKVR